MARRRSIPEATQYRIDAERARAKLAVDKEAAKVKEADKQDAIQTAIINMEVAEERIKMATQALHEARMSNGWTERMKNILGGARNEH